MTKFRQLLTLCLVAVLLAGVALAAAPAALASPVAAPAAQMNRQADDITGTYVSDVYPAASAPGLVQLMSLYPNQNAELVSYYFSNPPVIEEGTWESGAAGVVVTLTGSTEGTYDQPSRETFTVRGDTLVSRGFVLHKLDTITPAQMDAADEALMKNAEATVEATVEATTEATTEPAAEITATVEITATAEMTATEEPAAGEDAVGEDTANDETKSPAEYQVFATNVYPAADASGMVMLMALFPNNNMEQLSVYLGKDAILEVGTWAEGADGSIATTLSGQLDTDYETPARATYTRDGDRLTDGVFTFHPLAIVTPADLEAAAGVAGTYVSKLYPAADAPGMLTVLSLFANNNVEQVTIYIGKDAVMEQGTWAANDDGTITVTISGSGDRTYDTPSETTYTRNGDNLSDGIFEFARVSEVTPAEMDAASGASEESTTGSTSPVAAGTDATGSEATGGDAAPAAAAPLDVYKSGTLPAADSPGRVLTLSLYKGGQAELATDFLNGAPLIVETGTWESSEEGKLTLALTHGGDGSGYATPIIIGFDVAGGTLTAVDYDQSQFGSEGLTLHAEK